MHSREDAAPLVYCTPNLHQFTSKTPAPRDVQKILLPNEGEIPAVGYA
jgi:hypothetical protein